MCRQRSQSLACLERLIRCAKSPEESQSWLCLIVIVLEAPHCRSEFTDAAVKVERADHDQKADDDGPDE